jgi:ABC-type Fe3+-hydroxamate transport system substrate-binding protein
LVVGFGYTMPDYVSQLENLGIPVVILAPKDVNGVISDITLVGKITGAASQAKTPGRWCQCTDLLLADEH